MEGHWGTQTLPESGELGKLLREGIRLMQAVGIPRVRQCINWESHANYAGLGRQLEQTTAMSMLRRFMPQGFKKNIMHKLINCHTERYFTNMLF